jgi:hypothetical protein
MYAGDQQSTDPGCALPGQAVASEWAKSGGYPLADVNLALVAQYLSVTYRDAYRAKTEYLEFLKQRYLAAAAQDATPWIRPCSTRCAVSVA